MRELIGGLTAQKRELAVELANLPDGIRGYGHVKENNLKGVRVKWHGLAGSLALAANGQAQHAA